MEIKQRLELRKLLVPELAQSLQILSLPLLDLKNLVEEALENNPLLEENPRPETASTKVSRDLPSSLSGIGRPDLDFRINLISQKTTLQDVLLRQLGMFSNTDEELRIGEEIIGNIDENGYLKVSIEYVASTLNIPLERAEKTLKLIQQFEPPGVAARTASECLLIQLELGNESDPLIRKIAENHLEDIAKKNYRCIAKSLKEPLEKIEPLIKKILKLNPKPGANYSVQEIQRVVPDIIISEKSGEFQITINDEDIPSLNLSQDYKEMLKNNNLDAQAKEFLTQKLQNALELQRAISKRRFTLRRVVESIVEIQQDAIRGDFSCLKPLTYKVLAEKLKLNESTVSRAVMNKYVELPHGMVSLKKFFSSSLSVSGGESVSSTHIKRLIKDLIEQEDKKHPLSDQEIANSLSREKGLNISRRTVAKYREELKLLSTAFRRER